MGRGFMRATMPAVGIGAALAACGLCSCFGRWYAKELITTGSVVGGAPLGCQGRSQWEMAPLVSGVECDCCGTLVPLAREAIGNRLRLDRL